MKRILASGRLADPSRFGAARLWASQLICACLWVMAFTALAAEPQRVVINEIMYHPPAGRTNLQYVELFNAGATDADLSRWKFTKGIRFVFPENTRLAPGKYLVVCRDRESFAAQYGRDISAVGNFSGRLSRQSERLELVNSRGEQVDSVKYADRDGWPAAPDGSSCSLERICPTAASDLPANWAASNWAARQKPAGTPGRQNDSFSASLPPLIQLLEGTPRVVAPQQSVTVRAKVSETNGVREATLLYRVASAGREGEEQSARMTRVEGNEQTGVYEARIAGQPHGQLVRYRIRATGSQGGERFQPGSNDLRPAFAFIALTNSPGASVPIAYAINIGPIEEGPPHNMITRERPPSSLRGQGAFAYIPSDGGAPELFDYVRLVTRSGGYKVRFQKDRPLKGMSSINLIVEGPLRWILAEPLAYTLYRMANVPAPQTEHVRLTMDGNAAGLHLLIEQPNESFLARNGRDDTGNLYKLVWYGQTVTEQHQKRTNLGGGHGDLLAVLEGLKNPGPEQWGFIEKHFNVEEFASYYAVNMCIQNWDGFFNNHYLYHDVGKTGKWEVYPWDEDKTWGEYDGASAEFDWYEMPLTYGMTGDQSPRDHDRWGSGVFGGVSWWRPPGHFSGPLLANPEFRKRFLARLKEICTTSFNTQTFFPIIDAMEKRLEPEIKLRAAIQGQDPGEALREFADHMDSFREQVQHRRKFILKELTRKP